MATPRERMGTETGKRTVLRPPRPEEPPLAELEFVGCAAVPMTWQEFRRFEGRLEVWDAETETAWMAPGRFIPSGARRRPALPHTA